MAKRQKDAAPIRDLREAIQGQQGLSRMWASGWNPAIEEERWKGLPGLWATMLHGTAGMTLV